MQSKGWIRFVAILLAIASIWQLSFTVISRLQESKAAKYAEEQAQQFVEANNIAPEIREFVDDSVANIRNRAYVDSISAEKVFLVYTYKSVKEKEINLGLDLKGGMNVMLQVQLEDLVKALSGNSTDPDFVSALSQAKANNVNSSQDFIGLFEEAWNQVAPARRMAEVFGTYELRDKIKPESTNREVVDVIRNDLSYSYIRWVKNKDIDIKSLNLTSDTKWVQDFKGNNLLLFTSSWCIDWALKKNEGLALREFNRD